MIIKLSQSMSVGCLVSPLDYEDILAQEKRLEELTSAHGEAIRALAEYRAEVKSLNIVIGNLQNQVVLYACQPKLHDTDTLMQENARLREALQAILTGAPEAPSALAICIARAALEVKP